MTGKKRQSSVIVPRNEIDSHPAEREIALADDTAVTQPKTHCASNVNNPQQSLTLNLWTTEILVDSAAAADKYYHCEDPHGDAHLVPKQLVCHRGVSSCISITPRIVQSLIIAVKRGDGNHVTWTNLPIRFGCSHEVGFHTHPS